MSDLTTIARPYAKALFELALNAKQLSEWTDVLAVLAQAIVNSDAAQLLSNPMLKVSQQSELLLSIVAGSKQKVDAKLIEGFVELLAVNKRLFLIPGISEQYALLRAEQEKTMVVNVRSFTPLSEKQQQRLIDTLTKRLQRRIALEISIDKSLLGGALIQAGDLVIDGSVQGQLTKLASTLAA